MSLAAVLSARALAQPAPTANAAADARLEAVAVDALVSKATETPEEAEEITVQGQRRGNVLGKYRLEMTKARDNIVEVFNKVNTKNDTDVKCRTEKPTGTRMAHSVCRSKAEDAAQASAAQGMLQSLVRGTGTGGGANVGNVKFATATAAPAISPTASPGTVGSAGAQGGGEGGSSAARTALEAEMKKMMEENRDLFRAVVKYVELRDEYDKARGASDDVAAH
ncbi:MAG TPA: hypothetical protein VFJ95_03300 [Gammaproteobacteria bacterium]|nr:hypothetical protein [Gammaproteobacteria bacterium]